MFEDRHFRLSPCVPCPSPDQLSFDRSEERLYGGIVITIFFSAQGHLGPIVGA